MALSERLAILISANGSQAVAEFNKVGRSAERSLATTEQRTQRLGTQFTRVGAGAVVFGAVLTAGMYKAAQAAGEQSAANIRLENTMANQPALAGASAQSFYDQASALQLVTRFGDEATVSAQSTLGAFGLTQEQIEQLIPLVQDYAAKTGTDLVTAARNVGKATDGTNTTLKRAGVRFDDAAYSADNFAGTMSALQGFAGGFARQDGQELDGQLAILKNRFGELAEGVGGGAAEAFGDMAGVVDTLADGMDRLSPGTQSAIGQVLTWGAVGLTAAGATGVLVGQVLKLRPVISGVISLGPRLVSMFDRAAIAAYEFAGGANAASAASASTSSGAFAAAPVLGWTAAIVAAGVGLSVVVEKFGELIGMDWPSGLSTNVHAWNGEVEQAIAEHPRLVAALSTGKQTFNQFGTAVQEASMNLDELSGEVRDYLDGVFDLPEAQRNLRESFSNLFSTLMTEGHSVDDVDSSLQAIVESMAAVVSAGGDADTAALLTIQRLREQKTQGLITTEQFRTYRDAILNVPGVSRTLTETPGLATASADTVRYRGHVYSVPPNWSTTFVANTGSAIGNVKALRDEIGRLNAAVASMPSTNSIAAQIGAMNSRLAGESGAIPARPRSQSGGRSSMDIGSPTDPTVIIVSSIEEAMHRAGVRPDQRSRIRRRMLAGSVG